MSAPDKEAIDHAIEHSQNAPAHKLHAVEHLFSDVFSDHEDDLSEEDYESEDCREELLLRKRSRRSQAASQRDTQARSRRDRRTGR